jgi:preprotein translocase subunit YajC
MRQKVTNIGGLAKGMFGPLAAEKKKVVAASCLIAVMAVMWVRVLTKQAPEAAEAVSMTEQLNEEGSLNRELKVSFIELPQVAGRNDVITRDFFASDDWRHFDSEKGRNLAVIEEVNIVSKNGNEEVIRKIAEKLKLEAIVVLSKNPRAFINSKVMSVGDKVLIRDGIDKYECEVIGIEENRVVIKCSEAEVTLKLTQVSKINN